MKSLLSLPLTLVLLLPVTGCKEDFSCKDMMQGEWAIEFYDDLGENGDCPYEGVAILESKPHEIVCEVSGKQCVCNVGHEFGTYDVTFTNTETGETDRALIEVEAAPEPICFLRDAVGPRESPSGEGGAGGAGGASP